MKGDQFGGGRQAHDLGLQDLFVGVLGKRGGACEDVVGPFLSTERIFECQGQCFPNILGAAAGEIAMDAGHG